MGRSRGQVHRIDAYSLTESDDAYGGISITPSKILFSVPCRITVMDDEAKRDHFGEVTGEYWKVFADYRDAIDRSQLIKLAVTSIAAPITTALYYRVVWFKHQINRKGRFHHTSMIVEEEGADLPNQE